MVASSKKIVQFFVGSFHKYLKEAGGHIFVSKFCKHNPNMMVVIDDLSGFYPGCENDVKNKKWKR
jgi:hypothetical protein